VGIALALAAFWALLGHVTVRARWSIAATTVLATACVMSRASVGIGVVAALGLLALRMVSGGSVAATTASVPS